MRRPSLNAAGFPSPSRALGRGALFCFAGRGPVLRLRTATATLRLAKLGDLGLRAIASLSLARRVYLGFSGPGSYYTDSAYNLGADPIFSNISHSASTLGIQFSIQGVGIQSLSDESRAMDNLTITAAPVPVPAAAWLFGSGLLGLVGVARRKKAA